MVIDSQEINEIGPYYSLSAYRADEFEADHFETLALACKDMGFFLEGHGLDELISEVFAESKALSLKKKNTNTGYVGMRIIRLVILIGNLPKEKEIRKRYSILRREDMSRRRLAERLDGRKIGKHLGSA